MQWHQVDGSLRGCLAVMLRHCDQRTETMLVSLGLDITTSIAFSILGVLDLKYLTTLIAYIEAILRLLSASSFGYT